MHKMGKNLKSSMISNHPPQGRGGVVSIMKYHQAAEILDSKPFFSGTKRKFQILSMISEALMKATQIEEVLPGSAEADPHKKGRGKQVLISEGLNQKS